MSNLTLFATHNLLITFLFFFFNDTATTEIYPLPLHDALPISMRILDDANNNGQADPGEHLRVVPLGEHIVYGQGGAPPLDRKSTRLNSSHSQISYAVFCLKKKKIVSPTSSLSLSCIFTTTTAL